MHREGYGIIFSFAGAALLLLLLAYLGVDSPVMRWLALGLLGFALFSAYFFRDPERAIPDIPDAVLSPADGKVIEISEMEEEEFLKSRCRKISIFLNLFNVHVNRSPMSGTVRYFRYQKGKFLRANLPDASLRNEQTVIGLENGSRRLVFKQIAGLIARRISCDLREGHRVKAGERMGIIKFGSRVDVFLPLDTTLQVALGDRVRGGVSVIGMFSDVS